jgi:hypothetical protein
VSTTVHYRGRERFTLKDCEYYSTLQMERKVHTQGLLAPQYTTEGGKGSHLRTVSTTVNYRDKGSHSRTVSTTVHYRGRERFTLKDCEYYSKLQRERGSHSRAVGHTVHYRGRERYTLKDCEYYSTLERERKVHTHGLLVPRYTTEGEKGSHSRTVSTTVHYRGRERFTLTDCWYHSTLQNERTVHTQGLLVPQYTIEGEKMFTFKDCWYHSTLQREGKVHTLGL